ncbi:MAG: hypothetical protein AAGI01_00625 [Myxococcota bacterium]
MHPPHHITTLAPLAWLMLAPGAAWAQAPETSKQLTAQFGTGVEVDTNALREGAINENVGEAASGETQAVDESADFVPVVSGLARTFASLELTVPASPRARFNLEASAGGKVFFAEDAAGADVAISQAAARYTRRLGQSPFRLGASLDIKDRTERTSRFDYTRSSTALHAGLGLKRLSLTASAGWRLFSFKPDPATSSAGGAASVGARAFLGRGWSVSATGSLSQRRFTTQRLLTTRDASGLDIVVQDGGLRRDDLYNASLGVSWRGAAILDAAYIVLANRSNSQVQDLARQSLDATLTSPLAWGTFVSARVLLQRARFESPLTIDGNFIIEEDNRNAAILSLARPVGESWELELKYSLYTQAFGDTNEYSRQLFMFGVGYALSN